MLRNLWQWISDGFTLLLLVLVAIVGYPLLIGSAMVGGWLALNHGLDARSGEEGLELFSKRKGVVRRIAWSEIRRMNLCFEPPGCYPELTLANGELVALVLANAQCLGDALAARGIPVDLERRFRSEYAPGGGA